MKSNCLKDEKVRLLIKEYIKLPIYLCCSIILGTILMIGVYFLPTHVMKDNIIESVELLNYEGLYPYLIYDFDYSGLDNFTDALMIGTASYSGVEEPVYSAMMSPRYVFKDMDPIQALEKSLNISENDEGVLVNNYFRYWHGYLLFLKPLLLCFSYQEIRVINSFVQFLLLLSVVKLLSQKVGFRYAYAFGGAVLVLNPVTLSLSLQYSSVYYVALISMVILLRYKESFNTSKNCCLFLFSGVATAFLDLLTYPMVALGFLLVTYLIMSDDSIKFREMIVFSICWMAGYIGMWVGKWIMVSLLTEVNIWRDVSDTVVFRLNGDSNSTIACKDVIMANINILINKPIIVFLMAILILYVWLLLSRKVYLTFNPMIVPLIVCCFYPFLWYSIVKNHSIVHDYAYKEMAILVYAGLCVILKCTSSKRSCVM